MGRCWLAVGPVLLCDPPPRTSSCFPAEQKVDTRNLEHLNARHTNKHAPAWPVSVVVVPVCLPDQAVVNGRGDQQHADDDVPGGLAVPDKLCIDVLALGQPLLNVLVGVDAQVVRAALLLLVLLLLQRCPARGAQPAEQ